MISETIMVVSGLPRSGTSMMMKMLEAGGIQAVTDNIRQADDDNPKGYYELEKVKELDKSDESSWMKEAQGKAIKVISQLLKSLPSNYTYKVLFMQRKMDEILASQKQMLIRRGQPTDRISDEEMAQLFDKHLQQVQEWLRTQPNFDVMYVPYNEVLVAPDKFITDINRFLGGTLNTAAMKGVVDKSLHRQRA